MAHYWIHSDRVKPTTVTIITRHNGAHNLKFFYSYKKKTIMNSQFFCDRQIGVIVSCVITKNLLPKFNDHNFICCIVICANFLHFLYKINLKTSLKY